MKTNMKNKKKIIIVGIGVFVAIFILIIVSTTFTKSKKINKEIPLIVNYSSSNEMNKDLIKMTQLSLLTRDKNGDIVYNGEAADISMDYNSGSDTTKIKINLNNDIKFSDGKKLTSDDVIFSYYWLLNEKINKDSAVANLPIVGLEEYTYKSSNVVEILKAAREELENPTDSTKTLIADNIIAPFLTSQLEWIKTWYGNNEYVDMTSKYPAAKDLFAYLYAPKEKYNSTNYTESAVLTEVISQYGYDYDSLGSAYAEDEDYFEEQAIKQAIQEVSKKVNRGNEVSEISGIKKNSDTSIQITLKGFDASYIYDVCDIYVLPKHKYKSTSEVGTDIDCTVGAGMYYISEENNSEIKLTANKNYYGKEPLNTLVTLTYEVSSTSTSTSTPTNPSTSTPTNLDSNNSYMLTYSTKDYCYIGFNVNNVNVSGSPLSEESIKLRSDLAKAFKDDYTPDATFANAEYTLYIFADGTGNHKAMPAILEAKKRLSVKGIVLNIIDVADETLMWDAVNSGKAQMWCGVWNEKSSPQFKQKYHSSSMNSSNASYNPYKLNSQELDSMIQDYNSCKDKTAIITKSSQIKNKVESFAVEQVLYYKENTIYLSPSPKNTDQLFKTLESNYNWINELGNIQIVD